jgi:multisubunit Na+/H+ antiporter MnhB subunit
MGTQQPHRGRFDIGDQRGGVIHNVAGDQNTYVQGPTIDLLPSRMGRVVIVIGVLVMFAGFASFAYPVLSFILTIFDSLQQQSSSPPDLSQVHFVPFIPLGVVAEMAGLFLVIVGALMRRRRRVG